MSSSLLTVGVLLTVQDRASQSLARFSGNLTNTIGRAQSETVRLGETLDRMSNRLLVSGAGLTAAGYGLTRVLSGPVSAFADLEDASTNLKSSLLDSSGVVSPLFDDLNKKAFELGNLLPGTTEDFLQMFDTAISGGASAKDVLGGLGESTAFLSVLLKQGYNETAQSLTNFRQIAGLGAEDLLPFSDTLQRTQKLGISVRDLEFAFSRSAGALKSLDLQGLQSAQQLGVLFSELVKVTKSGEIAGSGFGNVLLKTVDLEAVGKANKLLRDTGLSLNFVDQTTGQFKGLDNLVGQFEKLRDLDQITRINVLDALVGNSGESRNVANALINIGNDGLAGTEQRLEKQADLWQRVQLILGTTKNKWDALTGSVENLQASLAKPAVNYFKPLLGDLNKTVGKFNELVDSSEKWVKTLGLGAGAIATGLTLYGGAKILTGGAAKIGGSVLKRAGGLLGKKGAAGALGGALGAATGGAIPVFVTNFPGVGSPDFPGSGGGKGTVGKASKPSRLGKLTKGGAALGASIAGATNTALAAPSLGAIAAGGAAPVAAATGLGLASLGGGFAVGLGLNSAIEGTVAGKAIDTAVTDIMALLGNEHARLVQERNSIREAIDNRIHDRVDSKTRLRRRNQSRPVTTVGATRGVSLGLGRFADRRDTRAESKPLLPKIDLPASVLPRTTGLETGIGTTPILSKPEIGPKTGTSLVHGRRRNRTAPQGEAAPKIPQIVIPPPQVTVAPPEVKVPPSQVTHDNRVTVQQITINAQPEPDGKQLADDIMREIERNQAVRSRSRLSDDVEQ